MHACKTQNTSKTCLCSSKIVLNPDEGDLCIPAWETGVPILWIWSSPFVLNMVGKQEEDNTKFVSKFHAKFAVNGGR